MLLPGKGGDKVAKNAKAEWPKVASDVTLAPTSTHNAAPGAASVCKKKHLNMFMAGPYYGASLKASQPGIGNKVMLCARAGRYVVLYVLNF